MLNIVTCRGRGGPGPFGPGGGGGPRRRMGGFRGGPGIKILVVQIHVQPISVI